MLTCFYIAQGLIMLITCKATFATNALATFKAEVKNRLSAPPRLYLLFACKKLQLQKDWSKK